MMTTVLPPPAPPNNPILPPFTNGAIRSITLMPVSNTSVFASRSTMFCLASACFVAMWSLSLESFRPTHDFGELLRDLPLSGAIERALQDVQHVTARVGGIFHRRAARAVLRGRRLDQRAVHLVLYI